MAKKRFGVSSSINKALSQTIQMAEAENTNFINTEILVERIKLDPDNPRRHKLTIDDLKNGPSNQDPDYEIKEDEYKGICELSASIAKEGLLHPIVVFKEGEDYKLVAGERRYLATVLAKKSIIDARVFKKKPQTYELKIIQWMENESRRDLSLYKKLMNIEAILLAYQESTTKKMKAIQLSEVICTSRQSAQYYISVLSNPILMEYIKEGKLKSLKVARQLSGVKSAEELDTALSSYEDKQKNNLDKAIKNKPVTAKQKVAGIKLGMTKQPLVAKTIVMGLLSTDSFKKYYADFESVDWTSRTQATKAFQKLIALLESDLEAGQ